MSPFFGAAEGRWFRFLAGTSQRASQPAASVADAEGDSAAVVNAAAAVEDAAELAALVCFDDAAFTALVCAFVLTGGVRESGARGS
ncbi:hypothetical protein AK812_SmicGene32742 [Symbiodinium microadriaticum]|uniref:Uncharacterized protein n=1 Tax=Symbiodinium microadriaticum TaxID=2951 RepID=A0A1Q9CTF3_SYMMI|nr:hypothetical protein AK812_SmicGene32742 [Symbiodinium microadriaticum]